MMEGKEWENTYQDFWSGGNVLFLDLGDGHMGVQIGQYTVN